MPRITNSSCGNNCCVHLQSTFLAVRLGKIIVMIYTENERDVKIENPNETINQYSAEGLDKMPGVRTSVADHVTCILTT